VKIRGGEVGKKNHGTAEIKCEGRKEQLATVDCMEGGEGTKDTCHM